jgi:addiction module HigA family antidote
MIPRKRTPSHPGEILLLEFLQPRKMTQVELAKRMNTLINGKRDVTAETAILLSRALETSSEFWMNLQVAYDLHKARARLMHAA